MPCAGVRRYAYIRLCTIRYVMGPSGLENISFSSRGLVVLGGSRGEEEEARAAACTAASVGARGWGFRARRLGHPAARVAGEAADVHLVDDQVVKRTVGALHPLPVKLGLRERIGEWGIKEDASGAVILRGGGAGRGEGGGQWQFCFWFCVFSDSPPGRTGGARETPSEATSRRRGRGRRTPGG